MKVGETMVATFTSKFDCIRCGCKLRTGERILKYAHKRWQHLMCIDPRNLEFLPQETRDVYYKEVNNMDDDEEHLLELHRPWRAELQCL